ncbi:hypothetical protein, partial [Stenotrophomonas maltophilia]|uniref:hypothetical protein n=1 Tax=Stenotrophomonas maltophilia TaxID=40324 RepID=UPI00313DB6EB
FQQKPEKNHQKKLNNPAQKIHQTPMHLNTTKTQQPQKTQKKIEETKKHPPPQTPPKHPHPARQPPHHMPHPFPSLT